MKKKNGFCFAMVIIFSVVFMMVGVPKAPAQTVDARTVRDLQLKIEKQQAELDMLKKQMEALLKAQEKAPMPKDTVTSGNKTATLKLYGQVNRGVLFADDGNDSNVFFVDNDNSSTRIGLIGEAAAGDNLTAGAKIEVQMESNSTASVNQNSKSGVGGISFTERHLDFYLKSKTMGKLSLGQGDTATNGTSEVDLSGTSLVGYSGVSDMAGGIRFYDQNAGSLSGVDVGDAMSNMDGMSRDDRIRYDTPNFAGFMASASFIADDAMDLALTYSGKFPGATLAGAVGYAFGEDRKNWDNQLNGSLSLLLDMGFNMTVAAGTQDYDTPGREDPSFIYGKIGYKWGSSALSVDYGQYQDVAANDDDAESFGIQFVHKVAPWSTEFYAGYRWYDLEREGTDYDSISAILTGARFKF